MPTLTARQAEILRFIKAYIKEHGYSPTRQEISEAHNMHANGSNCHILALSKKGAISVRSNKARAIAPTKGFRVRVKS